MTQSNKAIDTITLDLSDYPDEAFITDTGSDYTFNVSTNTNSSVISTSNLDSITTISGYTISSDDQISFDWDNIKIVPTLWKEALPDIYTVNNMCEEYPALAKAYENFQTIYKLVEQDYKGKKEDNT
jgi:hypothetical protein|tara:strand:+ start:34 stop:414 length:381 start_codon:yes stop_codon:yes gene_type:complete